MKKNLFLAIICLICSLMMLSSCSSDKSGIEGIKESGVLKAGVKVDVPKFGYKDPTTEKIEGFEIDLAKSIAKEILGDEEKLKLSGVNAKTRGPMLDNGELDIVVATFTITEERKKSYNFSDPYFTDGVAMMVKKDSGIKSFSGLDGKIIGVAQSSTTKKALEDEGVSKGIKMDFMEYGTYPEIKSALEAKRIDCFSVDGAILMGYIDDTTNLLPERLSPQEYGIASKLGNDELAKTINDLINEMKTNGEINKLLEKWEIK